jgi:MFS transporter, MHS family, shikimate and dehydroshikimate transport protein
MTSSADSRKLNRVVFLSTSIGTAIEQYDFLLFGALAASLFNKLFFPSLDPLAGTLASVGAFAVGVAGRPIGAMIAGHFGDRIGRKSMLLIGFTLMGLASAVIGLLPTYNAIGIWAPICLVALRLLQGVALGGEQAGASVLSVEHAPLGRRGLWGSFPIIGSYLGALMAFGTLSVISLVSGDAFETWGWRVPFLASLVLLFIGLVIRSRLPETQVFSEIKASGKQVKSPLLEVLVRYPMELAIATVIRFGNFGWSTIVLVVTVPYVVNYLSLPRSEALNSIAIASALALLITVPAAGYLSDKFGRRPLIIAAGIFTALFGWPYFWLLGTKDHTVIIAAVAFGFAIITPLSFAVEGSFFSEMFGANVRFSGVALGQQLGSILGGTIVPLFATYMLAKTGGDAWPIGAFCAVMGGCMAAAAFIAKETRGSSLSTDAVVAPVDGADQELTRSIPVAI